MKNLFFTFLLFLTLFANLFAQDRFAQIKMKLETHLVEMPGLSENVQLSISGASIQEFLTGLAENHKLNISVDPDLDIKVYHNFNDARVLDVLVFVCKQYNLDIDFTGSILSFTKFKEPAPIVKPYEPQKPKVDYNKQTDFLSLDLKKDSIDYVVKEITSQSLYNVILAPNAKNIPVSVFIQNRPFTGALEMLCVSNGLKLTDKGNNFFLIEKEDPANVAAGNQNSKTFSAKQNITTGLEISVNNLNRLTVKAENVAIKDILRQVSNEMVKNYFIYTEPQGNTSLYIENAEYDDFLNYLLNGTNYTYKTQDSIYLIGDRKIEGLRKTKLIKLKYRTVEKINGFIPAELKKDVDIQEFLELNGLIVSGSAIRIEEIENFIREIDQLVPMVMIEVIIVDSKKNKDIKIGVDAGLGKTANTNPTNGSISPGVQVDVSPSSVNDMINGFNGLGIFNLGKVVPQFYLSLQALETNGNIQVKSTPRISTINGNLATLKVGSQEYYLEQTSNTYASNTTQTTIANQYKSVNADLSIKIKPFVSEDNQVTLTITVDQSDFTGKIAPTAPPGTVSRTFESIIRVKDGEMVILGGLEEKSNNSTATGLPWISRIPVLRSIFGKTSKTKSTSQLTIFIKPTIIY